MAKANITADEIDIVNLHAGTVSGDENESEAVRTVFGQSANTYINCTKGFIGHAMGAAERWNWPVICPVLPTTKFTHASTSKMSIPNVT